MTDAGLTGHTVELLQHLIRNRCVNDGSIASGQEVMPRPGFDQVEQFLVLSSGGL